MIPGFLRSHKGEEEEGQLHKEWKPENQDNVVTQKSIQENDQEREWSGVKTRSWQYKPGTSIKLAIWKTFGS